MDKYEIFEVEMCSRLDDSEELMEEGRLAGLDGTIMQVLIIITMSMMVMERVGGSSYDHDYLKTAVNQSKLNIHF